MAQTPVDLQPHPIWKQYLPADTEPLWEGQPQIGLRIPFLEKGYYYDVITGPANGFLIYLILLMAIAWMINGPSLGSSLVFITVGILLAFAAALVLNYFERQTHYALTQDYLLFRFEYGLFSRLKAIPLADVISFNMVIQEKEATTFHFPNHANVKVHFYDFVRRERRDHPTFEWVGGAEELRKLLEQRLANQQLTPKTFAYPVVDRKVVLTLKRIYSAILLLLLMVTVDFYLLPNRIIKDNITTTSLHSFDYDVEVMKVYTAQGYHFRLNGHYSFEGAERQVEMKVSPVFGKVAQVQNTRMDYSDRLKSSLHGLGKYFYLAYELTIIGSLLILNTDSLKRERLINLLILNGFVLLLLWYVSNVI